PGSIEETGNARGIGGGQRRQLPYQLAALGRRCSRNDARRIRPRARARPVLRMLAGMNTPATIPAPATTRPASLLGWRLLSLLYDLFPALALWMLAGALFVVVYTLEGHGARENIAPFSAWQWALWACCWGI